MVFACNLSYFRVTHERPYSNLKQTAMRKFLTLTLVGMILSVVFASCGSSKGGHGCDAYGSVDQVNKSDLASK